MKLELLNAIDTVSMLKKDQIVSFLKQNVEDCYDSRETILNAVEYALNDFIAQGGFIVIAKDDSECESILGIAVVNKIGTRGYFPDNLLAYIGVHKNHMNKGIAEKILDEVLNFCKGSITFHVKQGSFIEKIAKKIGFQETHKQLRYNASVS